MAKVDSSKVAAAIAATEAVIEGTDPGGFGQSALRLAVNQIGAALKNDHPRFDVARFETDALPLQSARMRAAILRTLEAEGKTRTAERLEYLRGEIEAERISYAEVAELQSLADEIDPGDALLLEWAGVPEHAEPEGEPRRCECEGLGRAMPYRAEEGGSRYLCGRCGLEVVYVSAFRNADEWHSAEPLEEGREVGAGQCSSCGSFDPETGEPGRGFILHNVPGSPVLADAGRWVADCGCCGDRRLVQLRPHPEVVV